MSMIKPASNPSYPLDAQKKAAYMDFATATYAITSRDAFTELAYPYVKTIEAKYALLLSINASTEAKIAFMKDVLMPSVSEAINNLAKSGKIAAIGSAAGFKSTAENQKNIAISNQQQAIGILNTAKKSFGDVAICFENIKDQSVPASGAKDGYGDCAYWCRVIYLWDLWFSDISALFTKHNSLVNESLAKAQTAVNSVFDLDDAANGYSSFRNTHKELIAKEEYSEEKKQKKIADSKVLYEILGKKADESPISAFIWPVINNLWETGNYYTQDDMPKKDRAQTATPTDAPKKDRAQTATPTDAPKDNILLEIKYIMDSVVGNLYLDKFNDLEKINIQDMQQLASLCNGAYSMSTLYDAVRGKPKRVVIPRTAPVNFVKLAARAASALSTTTTETTGKTQAELQVESDRKAKEDADTALAEAKKNEDLAAIAQKEKDAIQAAVDLKNSEEAKKKEKDALVICAEQPPESKPPEMLIGPDDLVTSLLKGPGKDDSGEKFFDKEIAGIKMPYIIGGAVCLVGLVVVLRGK